MKRRALHDSGFGFAMPGSGSGGSGILRSAWVALLLALFLVVPGQVAQAAGPAMGIQLVQSGFVDNDGSGTVTQGDQLDFTTTVTNTGTVPLTNVHVTDSFNTTGVTCSSMAVGTTCILNSSHIVTAADVAAGSVTDTATATSNELPPQSSGGGSSTGGGSASLVAVLTSNTDPDGSGTVTAGDVLTYTFTATNTGATGLTGVVVATTGSAVAFSPNSATCLTLGPGTSCVLTSTYTVTAADATNGQIVASADVIASEITTPITTTLVTPVFTVAPPALTIASGNNQVLPINTQSAPLVVHLTNKGLPVANATINWNATNAVLASPTSKTNASGDASNTVILHQAGAASVSASSAAPAAGPVTFALNGGLASLPGLTPSEIEVANALDHACPALAAVGTLTVAAQDLLAQCQALASAAASNPDQVANALNQMLPHDALLQTNASILVAGAQFDNIKARLAALRSGSGGDHFGGLAFSSPEGVLPLGKLGETALGFDDKPADKNDHDKSSEVGGGFDRWGFFASGTFGDGSANARSATPGYGFRSGGITAGVDYRVNDHMIFGVSAGYASYSSNVDVVGGGLDTRGWSLSAYSSFFRQDNWYVDGVLTWGHNNYDINRRIVYALTTTTGTDSVNQTATSSSSGTTLAGALTLGRDFSKGPWSFGPYLRGTWTRTDFGSYQENLVSSQSGSGLGLSVQSRSTKDVSSVLGAKVNYASSQSWGVMMPHAEIEWEHDFENNPDSITAHFLQDPTATPFQLGGDSIDTDFFRLGLGLSFQFAHGRSGFIYYEKTLGLTGITQNSIAVGFRMEF
jgi:uncharacterized repeat protein (TIGR01451 family)